VIVKNSYPLNSKLRPILAPFRYELVHMKRLILLLFLTLTCECRALDITTRSGSTYRKCEVMNVEPDGLTVGHTEGVVKIPFEDLPKPIQERYHFDPAKGIAYRKSIEDARIAAATKLVEQQKQIALNRAKSEELEKERQRSSQAEKQRQIREAAESRKAQRALNGLTISPPKKDGLRLEHESYGRLLSEAMTKASNLNFSQDRTQASTSSIPPGGRLILHIERSTIGAANTQYFTIIVFDRAGKEIVRRSGDDSIAEVPGSDGRWWNIMSLSLPEISEMPVKIRVVDTLSNKATEFEAE
jgi:hypothetical protein